MVVVTLSGIVCFYMCDSGDSFANDCGNFSGVTGQRNENFGGSAG